MVRIYTTCDWNDGDTCSELVEVSEETFNRFKPLIDAINNYKPYLTHNSYASVVCNNWRDRTDEGYLLLCQKYPGFDNGTESDDFFCEFEDTFFPYPPEYAAEYGFHTIDSMKNIDTGELYIDFDYWKIYERRSEKIRQYEEERAKIYAYKNKKGISLDSIRYNEMNEHEIALINKAHDLWIDYVDDPVPYVREKAAAATLNEPEQIDLTNCPREVPVSFYRPDGTLLITTDSVQMMYYILSQIREQHLSGYKMAQGDKTDEITPDGKWKNTLDAPLGTALKEVTARYYGID